MLKSGFEFAPGYRLQEFLGRGQFGQVWRATAPGGAAAAVKFIDLSDGQGKKEYEGVKRVRQIRHANLMPITAIWLLDGMGKVIPETPSEHLETIDIATAEEEQTGKSIAFDKEIEPSWLVVAMLLGGQSLQQRLRSCVKDGLPGIPPKELLRYMDEAAKGIDFLNAPQHDLGEGPIAIQHSDVKPANIVLIGDSAVVCDFGLARILTRNQVTATSAAGTPAYMAPEAISGKPSRTSDQYALAVTYYHLRTGTLPVNDGSLWEVLDAHRHGKLKLGLVPEPEQDVIRKATDLKWENRFDSNVDMVDALRDALRAEGQTTPSFIPKNRDLESPSSIGPGDAVATMDLNQPVAVAQADQDNTPTQSLTPTAPFVQAEKSTKQGFAQDTMPTLDEVAAESQPAASMPSAAIESVGSEPGGRTPKLLAGIAAGGVIVASLFGLFTVLRGSSESPPGPEAVANSGTSTRPLVIEDADRQTTTASSEDPRQLVSQAVSLLDDDEAAAVAAFKQALKIDLSFEVLNPMVVAGQVNDVMKLLVTPNGEYAISVADSNEPFVWNLTSNDSEPITGPTRLMGHGGYISGMSMTDNGQRLLTGAYGDRVPRVWSLENVASDSTSLELSGKHNGAVLAVAWHPTEPIAITASDDDEIALWRIGRSADGTVGTITESSIFQIGTEISALRVDPAGRWLAVLSGALEHDVLIFAWPDLLNTFKEQASPEPFRLNVPTVKLIEFLSGHDQSRLVVGDQGGGVSIYRIGGPNDFALDDLGSARKAHDDGVEAIRVLRSADTDWIATGGADGSAHWWRRGLSDNKLRRQFTAIGNAISAIDISDDGRWVAIGTDAAAVWLWDTQAEPDAGAIMLPLGATLADSIRFDPNSRWLIAGCDDGKLRIWDLRLAKLLALASPTNVETLLKNPQGIIKLDQNLTFNR